MRFAPLALVAALALPGCYAAHVGEGGPLCGGRVCTDGNVCCPTCDGAGMCQTADLPCPDVFCPEGCRENRDCGPGEWCARPTGRCDILGDCRPRPTTCPGDCPGVCGCDGMDYCNECAARSAGTNVASAGFCGVMECGGRVCPPGVTCCPLCFGEVDCVGTPDGLCPDIFCPADCVVNEECGPGEYCAFEPGACGPTRVPGQCAPRPEGCPEDCPGVCGCDGATYCNECIAAQAGVNFTFDVDACGPRPCGRGGEICEDGRYCDLGPMCGAADGHRCRTRPASCPDGDAPVCGCDGRTYRTSCVARMAGATVAQRGACPVPEVWPSCLAAQLADPAVGSGALLIAPEGVPVEVFCDQETDGGGWTLVAASRGVTLDDALGDWHPDLVAELPTGAHPGIWGGMRALAGARADVRFTCGSVAEMGNRVDLSFYDVVWYGEWTTGSDADSCFSESDGMGFDLPPPRRRDNLTGVTLPAGTPWGAGYLEGEDFCGDDGDFTVDLRDRGMDSNEADGTDWGEDDSSPKCGSMPLFGDGVWQIWVRER